MPRFVDLLGGLTGFTQSHIAMTSYGEKIQSQVGKGKRHMRQSLEETRQKLPRVKSHRTCVTPPALDCGSVCENVVNRGRSLETRCAGFLSGPIM